MAFLSKLSLEDKILMTLQFWRKYYIFEDLGDIFGIDKSTCYRIIVEIEKILISHPDFALSKRSLLKNIEIVQVVLIVNASECRIQRPKKNQKKVLFWEKEVPHKKISNHYWWNYQKDLSFKIFWRKKTWF